MKLIITAFLIVSLAACNGNDAAKTETTTNDSMQSKMAADTMTATTTVAENAPMPDSATMMKNWQAYMTPGEPHKLLASWDGTWTGDIKMWMAPGAPPQVTKGTAVNKMILGGRYQHSTHSSLMMGMPFEGEATTGYDNTKKKFVSSWIDNMGSGVMTMEGDWDESTKTLTLVGKCIDPMAGNGREMTVKQTQKVIDQNTQLVEMFSPGPDGKEFKMMEIKMTRK
ncbi:MAG: DUF1579 domain-containing protein [Ferruginibacter sp.]